MERWYNPQHLTTSDSQESCHRVVSTGELLALPLTDCSTREIKLCISSRLHCSTGPGRGGTGESALKMRAGKSWPHHSSTIRCNGYRGEVLPHHPSPPVADGRAGTGVLRAGKVALSLTDCSTWESEPNTSPGQHSNTGLGGGGTNELTRE